MPLKAASTAKDNEITSFILISIDERSPVFTLQHRSSTTAGHVLRKASSHYPAEPFQPHLFVVANNVIFDCIQYSFKNMHNSNSKYF